MWTLTNPGGHDWVICLELSAVCPHLKQHGQLSQEAHIAEKGHRGKRLTPALCEREGLWILIWTQKSRQMLNMQAE